MFFACHLRRLLLLIIPLSLATADEGDVEIRRGVFENPVEDPLVLAAHQNPSASGALPAAIGVRLSDRFSYLWDTLGCRMLAGWSGDFLKTDEPPLAIGGEVIVLAAGKSPLSSSTGGVVAPEYYGFELDEAGVPTFQYLVGVLAVSEKISLDAAGDAVVMQWSVKNSPTNEVLFTLPKSWKAMVKLSAGEWMDDQYVRLSKEDATDFKITLPLKKVPTEPIPPSKPVDAAE